MTLYITGSSFLEFTFLRKEVIGKGWMHRWMGKGFLSPFWKWAYVTCVCLGAMARWELLELQLQGAGYERGWGRSGSKKHWTSGSECLGSRSGFGLSPLLLRMDLILLHFLFPFCHLSWLPSAPLTFTLKGTTPVCSSGVQGREVIWPGSPGNFEAPLRNRRSNIGVPKKHE